MEISACGKSERLPEYFAYIAGYEIAMYNFFAPVLFLIIYRDTGSCSTATEFMCYVFYSTKADQIANIVYSIGKIMMILYII